MGIDNGARQDFCPQPGVPWSLKTPERKVSGTFIDPEATCRNPRGLEGPNRAAETPGEMSRRAAWGLETTVRPRCRRSTKDKDLSRLLDPAHSRHPRNGKRCAVAQAVMESCPADRE